MPGRALLTWPVGLAAALILFNDFWLKRQAPGWWSGKLSDLALCFFTPIWLYALAEGLSYGLARLRGQVWAPWRSAWPVWICCGLVGGWLAALQLWPAAARFHVQALGLLFGRRFVVTPDASDLLALAVLPLTAWHLRRGQRRQGQDQEG